MSDRDYPATWGLIERELARARFEWMTTTDLRELLRDTLKHYDERTDRQFLRDLTEAIAQRDKHGDSSR